MRKQLVEFEQFQFVIFVIVIGQQQFVRTVFVELQRKQFVRQREQLV